jgi:hypothetical protein
MNNDNDKEIDNDVKINDKNSNDNLDDSSDDKLSYSERYYDDHEIKNLSKKSFRNRDDGCFLYELDNLSALYFSVDSKEIYDRYHQY